MILLATGFDILDIELNNRIKNNIIGRAYSVNGLLNFLNHHNDITTIILSDFFPTGSLIKLTELIFDINPRIHIIHLIEDADKISELSTIKNVTIMPQKFSIKELNEVIKKTIGDK